MILKHYEIQGINIGEYSLSKDIELDSEKFDAYFENEHRMKESKVKELKKNLELKIDILRYIEIYPKFRKNGFGKKLLDKIKSECSNDILLIAETKDDFLVSWYEKEGFSIIGYCHNLPVLLFKKTL